MYTALEAVAAAAHSSNSSSSSSLHHLQQSKVALQQNVQEKFAYDKLMQELARL